MDGINPNSTEAIIAFAIYICAQDNNISEEEISKLFKSIPFIKYDPLFIQSKNDLNEFIAECSKFFKKKRSFLTKNVSAEEKSYFEEKLTDSDARSVALRIARIVASSDGFHQNENHKFIYWIDIWEGYL